MRPSQGTVKFAKVRWQLSYLLQAVTGVVFSTFILGMFYRSASLYHPQRRAILHLKSIKRKIKEKNKSQEDKQPFFDVSCLKSVTFRIMLASTGLGSLGLYTPLIYMVRRPALCTTFPSVDINFEIRFASQESFQQGTSLGR